MKKKTNIFIIILAVFTAICVCSGLIFINLRARPEQDMVQTETLITTDELSSLTKTSVQTETPTLTLSIPALTETSSTQSTNAVFSAPGAFCIPNNPIETAEVVKIIDGDTIEVLIDGQEFRVRYIGINAPEYNEYVSRESTNKNAELVLGKQVSLIRDVSDTDRYDRLLRYVVVDNVFVNYELAEQGYAKAVAYEPDTACHAVFVDAHKRAKLAALGVWAATSTPTVYVVPTMAPGSNPSGQVQCGCDPSYPDVCIPPSPPDLDCSDIPFRNFRVTGADPHNFDGDGNGIGCEME